MMILEKHSNFGSLAAGLVLFLGIINSTYAGFLDHPDHLSNPNATRKWLHEDLEERRETKQNKHSVQLDELELQHQRLVLKAVERRNSLNNTGSLYNELNKLHQLRTDKIITYFEYKGLRKEVLQLGITETLVYLGGTVFFLSIILCLIKLTAYV